jgi:hypothetical protein
MVNQQTTRVENKTFYCEWPTPAANFERCHRDFFHLLGHTYFIIIDARSKWIEVEWLKTTTASDVIAVLRQISARFGLFSAFVADNGPPFGSSKFQIFLQKKRRKLDAFSTLSSGPQRISRARRPNMQKQP